MNSFIAVVLKMSSKVMYFLSIICEIENHVPQHWNVWWLKYDCDISLMHNWWSSNLILTASKKDLFLTDIKICKLQ